MYVEAIASGGGSDWFYVLIVHAPSGAEVRVDDGDEDIEVNVPSNNDYVGIPVHNENSTYTITVKMNGIAAPTQTFTTGSTSGQMTEKTFEFAEIQLNYDDEFRGQTISFSDGTHSPSPAITLPGAPDNDISIFVPCAYAGNWTMTCVDPVSGDTFPSAPNPIPVPGTPGIVPVHLFVIPDGKTVTPTDRIDTWLLCANIKEKTYTTLEEVLDDPETLIKLMASDNAVDYMVRSKTWIKSDALVPTLTADSNLVIKSSEQSTSAWKAFDGDTAAGGTNKWVANSNANEYVGYTFTSPKTVGKVKVWNEIGTWATQGVKNCQVEYSDDNSTWLPASAQVIAAQAGETEIITNETDPHTYWRLRCIDNYGGTYITVGELQFYSIVEGITDNQLAMEAIGQNDYAAGEVLDDSDWVEAIVASEYFEDVLNSKVPTMTSLTEPEGEVFGNDLRSGMTNAWRAFDGNDSTDDGGVWSWDASGKNSYEGYEFINPNIVRFVKYSGRNVNYHAITKVRIIGAQSQSGPWTTIDEVDITNGSTQGSQEFTINNNTAYKCYAIQVLVNDYFYFDILQFYGREAGGVLSWLNAAGISKPYLTLEEVISDRETLQALMMSHDAVDYLVTAKSFIDAITSSKEAMICIGNSNYAADTLLADSEWNAAICSSAFVSQVLKTVPAMTSNTTPSGEVIFNDVVSPGTDYRMYQIFAGISDYTSHFNYIPTIQNSANSYAGYDFETPVVPKRITLQTDYTSGNYALDSIKVMGSNDKTTWHDLGVIDCSSHTGNINDYGTLLSNNDAYRYIVLQPSCNSGGTYIRSTGVQIYAREDVDETKIEIYSAANDQVYYMASGSPSILGTTDANGHLTINRSALPEGDVTIYSNVAKDPNNLSNAYAKTFEITANTRALWVMPENALYWYGYQGTMEVMNTANGWSMSGVSTFGSPTFNQQDVDIYHASYFTAIASSKALTVGALNSITKTVSGSGVKAMGGFDKKSTAVDNMNFYSFVASTDDNSYKIQKQPGDIIGYPYLSAVAANHLDMHGFWASRKNRIANFFSAANDTVYYMSGGVQVVFAETNEFGEAYVDYTKLTPGTYDLYSSVADDPDNIGSAFYHRQFTISPNTNKIYLMPDNTLYWYGYQDPEYFANVVRNRITFNVDNLYQIGDTGPEVGFMTDYPFKPGVVSRINVIEEFQNYGSYGAIGMMYNALPSGTGSMSGNRTSIGRTRTAASNTKGLSYFDLTSATATLYLGYYTEYTTVYNKIYAIWYE